MSCLLSFELAAYGPVFAPIPCYANAFARKEAGELRALRMRDEFYGRSVPWWFQWLVPELHRRELYENLTEEGAAAAGLFGEALSACWRLRSLNGVYHLGDEMRALGRSIVAAVKSIASTQMFKTIAGATAMCRVYQAVVRVCRWWTNRF